MLGRRVGAATAAFLASLAFLDAAVAVADEEAEARHFGAPTYPLVFLAQGDVVSGTERGVPDDPPAGTSVRLARLRVGEDVSAYFFRARVVLEARSQGRDGAWYSEVEGGRIAGPMRLTDAYLSYVPDRAFHAELGSLRVPFSLSRQVDEADLTFPVRAPIIQAVAPDFRVGVGAGGDLGALSYAVAVLAASPMLDDRLFDRGAMFAVRLSAEPIGPIGLVPWRRTTADPWYGWFRFSAGVSLLDGSIDGVHTTLAGADGQLQWRRFLTTLEVAIAENQSFEQLGAVIEPAIAWRDGHLLTAARADWRRARSTDEWGAGAAVTALAPDPRVRVQLGFERRTAAGLVSGWAIARLTLMLD